MHLGVNALGQIRGGTLEHLQQLLIRWAELTEDIGDTVIVFHCCPRQGRPVAWAAENIRFGETPASYLGGGLLSESSRPVQVMPKPG